VQDKKLRMPEKRASVTSDPESVFCPVLREKSYENSRTAIYLTKPFSKADILARVDTYVMMKHLYASRKQAEDEAKALSREMELARNIQTCLLPISFQNIHPDFEIAATMVPADRVGGDFYEVVLDDSDHFWISIGDVSGHGVTPD